MDIICAHTVYDETTVGKANSNSSSTWQVCSFVVKIKLVFIFLGLFIKNQTISLSLLMIILYPPPPTEHGGEGQNTERNPEDRDWMKDRWERERAGK